MSAQFSRQTSGLAQQMLPRINLLAKRCAEIGWHLDFSSYRDG
jgi:hypothetical protein